MMMSPVAADQLINILLSPSIQRETFGSTPAWFKAFRQQAGAYSLSIDRALLGGRISQCFGFAFAAGYQSAIEALFQAEQTRLAAFCVSEKGGNHPRMIHTRLEHQSGQLIVTGEKSFVSGGVDAAQLYVACHDLRSGNGLDHNGRPCLKVLQLTPDIPGVEVKSLPPLGFMPEVTHGRVSLESVVITESMILSGDGYQDYIKPFRTYEDVHVLASICGYRLAEAIDGRWPEEIVDQYLTLIMALRSLSQMQLSKAPAHIGLAAIREQFDALVLRSNTYFEKSNTQAYEHWIRDQHLLQVARSAHEKRTSAARQTILQA